MGYNLQKQNYSSALCFYRLLTMKWVSWWGTSTTQALLLSENSLQICCNWHELKEIIDAKQTDFRWCHISELFPRVEGFSLSTALYCKDPSQCTFNCIHLQKLQNSLLSNRQENFLKKCQFSSDTVVTYIYIILRKPHHFVRKKKCFVVESNKCLETS